MGGMMPAVEQMQSTYGFQAYAFKLHEEQLVQIRDCRRQPPTDLTCTVHPGVAREISGEISSLDLHLTEIHEFCEPLKVCP